MPYFFYPSFYFGFSCDGTEVKGSYLTLANWMNVDCVVKNVSISCFGSF